MKKNKKPEVVHMVTSANSVGLMKGQLSYLIKSGFNVTVITSPGSSLYEAKTKEKINVKAIEMERTISPLKDFIALIKIIIYFLRVRPDICNSGTPKAGLLGMIAAWISRVPVKVYTVRGLPLEGASGFKKKILTLTERIACFCADKVICISPSIEKKIIDLKISTNDKTIVFGAGSSNGLQIEDYRLTKETEIEIKEIQKKNNLNRYDFIIGYVGRINNFKGVEELVDVFENLQKQYKKIALLLVGKKEEKDSISDEINEKIINNPHIIEIGRVDNPVPYYYIMDILAFPTHREGFGNVSIEAQATGTPVITTNATGAIDTVVDGVTGYIIDVGDTQALQKAILKLMKNPNLIETLGENGKKRVEKEFDSRIIWNGLEKLYRSELK